MGGILLSYPVSELISRISLPHISTEVLASSNWHFYFLFLSLNLEGILIPWPVISPMSPKKETHSPACWTAREFPQTDFLKQAPPWGVMDWMLVSLQIWMLQMNLFAKQKQTHRHREQTYRHQGAKRGIGWIVSLGLIVNIGIDCCFSH